MTKLFSGAVAGDADALLLALIERNVCEGRTEGVGRRRVSHAEEIRGEVDDAREWKVGQGGDTEKRR